MFKKAVCVYVCIHTHTHTQPTERTQKLRDLLFKKDALEALTSGVYVYVFVSVCVCVYIRINNARIFKSDAKCLELINFTSSFRTKKSILYDVLKYSSSSGGCDIQYLYNIYKR